jgi:hypothetical protein
VWAPAHLIHPYRNLEALRYERALFNVPHADNLSGTIQYFSTGFHVRRQGMRKLSSGAKPDLLLRGLPD